MIHESFDESVEMYLKTVCELAAGGEGLVPISALAKRLSVSTVSATEMVHRLCEKGLLEHTPYKGIALTQDGKLRALRVIRKHRLWECFLSEQLGLPWQAVHDSACQLEHVTNRDVVEALAAFLGEPDACPHGNPIPGPDGQVALPDDRALSELRPGEHGQITRIFPESTLLLDYLATHHILPGKSITFDEIAPFNGPLMVTIDDQPHALGREIASQIFIDTVPVK